MKKADSDARRATMLHLRELVAVATVTSFAACQPDEAPPPKTAAPLPLATGSTEVDAMSVPVAIVDAGARAPDLVDASAEDASAKDASSSDAASARPRRDAGVVIKPAPKSSGYEVVDMLPPPARRPPRSKP